MFLLVAILFLINTSPSFAQESTTIPTPASEISTTINPTDELIKQYRSDHQYNYDLYNKAYLEYTQKKQVHTKYGTLTTQQEKIDATKNVLIARNNALSTYLTALKVTLDKFKSINTTQTEKYQIELQKWVDWLNEQNKIAKTLNNDEDIKSYSQTFNQKYTEIQQLLYTSLTFHQINQKYQNLADLQNLSSSIQNDSSLKITDTSWTTELTIKSEYMKSALEKSFEATKTTQYTNRFNDFYPTAKKELTKSVQYLTDIISDLKAVVIKSQ